MSSTIVKSVTLLLGAILVITSFRVPSQANAPSESPSPVQQTDQAGAALKEGRRLLKRGRTDQALIQLQAALNLKTTAKNSGGWAAARTNWGIFTCDRASIR